MLTRLVLPIQFSRAMDIYQQLNEQPEAVRLTLDEDPSCSIC